jgi:hypothetical protein
MAVQNYDRLQAPHSRLCDGETHLSWLIGKTPEGVYMIPIAKRCTVAGLLHRAPDSRPSDPQDQTESFLPHMLCPSNHSQPTLRDPNPRLWPPPRASCRRLLRPPGPIVCAAAGPLVVLLRRHRPGHSRHRRPFPNLPQRRLQNPFRRRRCGAPPSPAASQGLPRPLPLALRSRKHQNGRR